MEVFDMDYAEGGTCEKRVAEVKGKVAPVGKRVGLFSLFLLPSILMGEYKPVPPTLAEILSHHKSITRDFFLTEYMKATKNPGTAYKAYTALRRVRGKHFRILAKRFPTQFMSAYQCVDVRPSYLRKVDVGCILEGGLSYRTLYKLPPQDKRYLVERLPAENKFRQVAVLLLNKAYNTILSSPKWTRFFLQNYPYFLKPVFSKIDWKKYIKDAYGVVHNTAIYGTPYYSDFFNKLNKEIVIQTPDKMKWDLALIAIRKDNIPRAITLLKAIKNKKSKHYFWLYLLTKDRKYLKILSNFHRVNLYTLYAYEEMGKKFKLITKVNHNTVKNPPYDQFDPWSVAEFKRYFWKIRNNKPKLFELARQLDSPKSFALKAFVLDRAYDYNKNYFLIPPQLYRDRNTSFRAYVYAIARQESRFIPGEVSIAYALGVMQTMPFIVREYGGNIYNQFDYGENVKMGVRELKGLFRSLHNPLLVAYAYNGGIGFVRRRVLKNFHWNGKYQPFLSMEIIPKSESRYYGKIVLANYIIYQQLFGKNITLHQWLEEQRRKERSRLRQWKRENREVAQQEEPKYQALPDRWKKVFR